MLSNLKPRIARYVAANGVDDTGKAQFTERAIETRSTYEASLEMHI